MKLARLLPAILLLVACGSLPASVSQQFDGEGRIRVVERCVKPGDDALKTIADVRYVVSVGDGHVGTRYYFAADGTELGSIGFTDYITPTALPLDMGGFACETVRREM